MRLIKKIVGVKVAGCLFQFRQALMKKISKLGLKNNYLRNIEFKKWVSKIMALPLLKIIDVENVCQNLVDDAEKSSFFSGEVDSFLKYLESVWFGRNATYKIEVWNFYRLLTRTNNPKFQKANDN